MKTEFKDGKISFNFSELLDCMTPEEKAELVEQLSCEEQIIDHVASQIVSGYTANVSHGPRSCGFELKPSTALDKARRLVVESANEVAKKELEDCMRGLAFAIAWQDHYKDWAFMMYHGWGKTAVPPNLDYPTIEQTSKYKVIKEP